MFSASRAENYRSRSSFNKARSSLQPSSVRLKAGRSTSVDSRSRATYAPAMKRTSSEERKPSNGPIKWSNPRKSSINVVEGKKIMKDPRPLTDKNYQKTRIRELFEFLEQADFKSSATEASLLSPNKSHFEVIFKFLYNILDPDYAVQKLEDDVPKILKMQQYPFSINKSAFTYVAKYNWPSLLGILFWLLDMCKFVVNFDVTLIYSSGDCERPHENAILIPYICSSYFSGPVDEEVQKEVFTKIVRSRRDENLEELEKKYEESKARLEKIEEIYNAVQQLICDNELLDSQIAEYEVYFARMKQHIQNKIDACEQKKVELKQKESELEKLKDEIAQKHEIYDAQGFDGRKQQQHFNALRKELHESREQKDELLHNLQDSCYEMEIQNSQTLDQLKSVCEEFNNLYASVAESAARFSDLIKHSKCAKLEILKKNVNFEFPKLQLSGKLQDMVSQTETCKEVLQTLQKSVDNSENYIQAFSAGQKQHLNNLVAKETDLSLHLKILNSKFEKQEQKMESEREEDKEKVSKSIQQYDAKVKDLHQLKENRLMLENIVKEMSLELISIQEFRQQKEKELGEFMEKKEKVCSIMRSNLDLCQKKIEEHQEDIFTQLKTLKSP